jgi:ATP-dependent DNA helicase RecQ
VERAFAAGELDLLYVAPERLLTPRFLSLLDEARVALFAIDEAHCVSQWGHDFRPEYREAHLLHERWPSVPRIALTARPDAPTRREIVERLGLEEARQFVSSFDRPNITYTVVAKHEARRQLLDFLSSRRGRSGIVYCLSRRKVDQTAEALRRRASRPCPTTPAWTRRRAPRNQRRFLREDGIVMVATIAFGMGIDKPDVRFVAHLDLPKSWRAITRRPAAPAATAIRGGVAGLRARRLRAAAADDRGLRASEDRKRWSAARSSRCWLLRIHRVPAQTLLRLFRRTARRPVRQLRQLPRAAAQLGRTVAAQKGLVLRVSHGPALRCCARNRCVRGAEDAEGAPVRARPLSTYGIGADLDARQWRSVFRQLVARRLVAGGCGGARRVPPDGSSAAVLKGECAITLRSETDRAPKSRRATNAMARPTVRARRSLHRSRRPASKPCATWRAGVAREQNVPAYVIFHDATLRQIAMAEPADLDALAHIQGVGATKLERYGRDVLEALSA